jgi:hypothetical protein
MAFAQQGTTIAAARCRTANLSANISDPRQKRAWRGAQQKPGTLSGAPGASVRLAKIHISFDQMVLTNVDEAGMPNAKDTIKPSGQIAA